MHKVLAQEAQAQALHAKLWVQALHEDELCTRSLAQRASGAGVARKALSVGLAQGPCTRGSGAGLARGFTLYKDLAQVARVPALHKDELCTRSLAQELRAQTLHAELWVQALHKVLAQEARVRTLHKDSQCTRTLHKSLWCRPCTRICFAQGP